MTKAQFYQPRTVEVVFWLLCALVAIGTTCLLSAQRIRATEEASRIAAAPRVTDDDLTLAYKRNQEAARRRFDHKRLIVTGTVGGMDEGLFGDGCIHMGEAVICDVGGHFGGAASGRSAMVVGTCKGKDAYGAIWISDAYVLKP